MTMRVAIIDLGTNTFNLVIAEVSNTINFIFNTKEAVKLGEGGIENNWITESATERAVKTLVLFKKHCEQHHVTNLVAFGTSAIRNAKNQAEFLKHIEVSTGLTIQVIDGMREAELIYKGVSLGVDLNKAPSLIMDIGGGSTEFIIANAHEIFWKKSYELGAARLLERFHPSNPISETEIHEIENYISQVLKDVKLKCDELKVSELIGSSGSFDTFAEVIQFRINQPIDLNKQTEYRFNLKEFERTYRFLCSSTFEERLNTQGIIPIRAEMIVVSGILTQYILTSCNIESMRLSTFALKEGVLAEMIE